MSLAAILHRRLLLPAYESGYQRRRVFPYWRELERTQWMNPQALEAIQLAGLQRLLTHAFEHSPYYRETWTRLGLTPQSVTRREDLALWPITDRQTIRLHRLRMRTQTDLIAKSTGGSSGEPLHFDLDRDSNDRRTAAWHRGYAWAHAAPGTKQLYLWGVPPGERPTRARVKDALYHALYRRRVVSCFDMSGRFAEQFAERLDRERPDTIVAYVNPLYEIARGLETLGIRPRFRPRSIVVGAEKLYGFQRECIERVFGAPVFETYGSREFMLIGAECERHNGLHLTAEHLIVEVLDDDGRPTPNGEEGNIVITDLTNTGMPFIRYATGDRALAGFDTCPCGRGLPLLRQVVGRRLDVIHGADGRILPGEFFPHLVKDFPAVRHFQVVQDAPRRVSFSLVTDAMPAAERSRLEGLVRSAVGAGVDVDFADVESIPLTPAGKRQVVINRVADRRAA